MPLLLRDAFVYYSSPIFSSFVLPGDKLQDSEGEGTNGGDNY